MKYDNTRSGRLEKKTFSKALNQLPVQVADDQADLLFSQGEAPDARGHLDIKHFIEKVVAASKYNPGVMQALQTKAPGDKKSLTKPASA
jgi:Ca2+-binding EF-hand superfamily protein